MSPLNIAGQGANSTRHFMLTNDNASGATEALKLNQPNATIDRRMICATGLSAHYLQALPLEKRHWKTW